jgi:hypothetical protein
MLLQIVCVARCISVFCKESDTQCELSNYHIDYYDTSGTTDGVPAPKNNNGGNGMNMGGDASTGDPSSGDHPNINIHHSHNHEVDHLTVL